LAAVRKPRIAVIGSAAPVSLPRSTTGEDVVVVVVDE
jgi:putative transposon-encoded protein